MGFQIQNNIWIIKGSDYGGSDNRGSTLLKYLMIIEIPYSGKLDWWGGKFGEFVELSVICQTETIQLSTYNCSIG